MTAGYLVFVPVVIGWITIAAFTPSDEKYHWSRWLFIPWPSIMLTSLALLITDVEGLICVIHLAVPITLLFGSIGGVAAGLTSRAKFLRSRSTLACFALLPILLSAAEMQTTPPLQLRTVQNSILIHAPAATIWTNIKRVPAIQPREIAPNWTHRIGFPLPIEATLDHDGVGGIRHASFQGGLLFIETITDWQPQQKIAFTIAADTDHIPPGTLDEHVTIGGRYFDVLNGEYRLEPLPNGNILLHLSSEERVSTDFNAYTGLWSDAVMRNLQQSILEVVKHRCESASIATDASLNP